VTNPAITEAAAKTIQIDIQSIESPLLLLSFFTLQL